MLDAFGCIGVYLFTKKQNSGLDQIDAFADDKIKVTKKLKFVMGRVENIVGKGENDSYQYFLLFRGCFQKTSFPGSLKV